MYQFFQSLIQKLANVIISVANWFASLITNLWESFKKLFEIVILFFQGIWYLITKVFDIVVLVVQVIFGLFKVVLGVVSGIFHTFSTLLSYSGSTDYYYMPQAYQQGWDVVANFLSKTGLNTIALVLLVFVWMLTAYAVIRIAGGER